MPDLVTMAPGADGLLAWFAETTVVASVLAVAATLIVRSRWLAPGPAARHALWMIVLLKMVTPPLVYWPWKLPDPLSKPSMTPIESVAIPIESPGLEIARLAASSVLEGDEPSSEAWSWPSIGPGLWVSAAWLVGSIALGVGQARRIRRFHQLLNEARPAPPWLVAEAERVSRRLAIEAPPIQVVPRLGTPLLWCLGRPILLVPLGLLETLETGRWRAILGHELAHLKRGDQWVRRLQLLAGLVWWWNPLYWLARSRIDLEAELACDAWALWSSPEDRLTYAESLIQICTSLSADRSPTPALSVAGTGRSFERRLTMILRDRVDRNVSVLSLAASMILAALALPSWSLAGPVVPLDDQKVEKPEKVETIEVPVKIEAIDTIDINVNDDDDEDDDEAKVKAKEKASKKAKAERKAELQAKKEGMAGKIKKEIEGKFGPDSEFAKKMESMGKEIEAKMGPGSEFAKKMETMNKEIEAKFGPDSEFAKQMEAMGKEIEAKFGPGSEFAKQMEALGKSGGEASAKPRQEALKAKLKAEGDARKVQMQAENEARKLKLKAEGDARKARDEARRTRDLARAKPTATPSDRTKRIEALEAQIQTMMKELKDLKDSRDDDKQNDEG